MNIRKRSILLLLAAVVLCLCACLGPGNTDIPAPSQDPESAASDSGIPVFAEGSIRITEVMVRNHATLRDEDGDFPDWIELHNESGFDIVLEGWSLSDRDRKPGLVFPAFLFPADSYCVVFASGKDRPSSLHAPFSLSVGETLFLRAPDGTMISRVPCEDLAADRSFALQPSGELAECLYPTPGYENSAAAYDALQERAVVSGPIILNEVLVSDPNAAFSPYQGSDWVELKNISDAPVSLSGWYLSDDDDFYLKSSLPEVTLEPGELAVIRFDQLGFSINAGNDALFLSHEQTGLCDWLALRDIPYGGSYGRMSGENGAFFFPSASPDEENSGGKRRVSSVPVLIGRDGIFDYGQDVILDLQANGQVFYTFDATIPTEQSLRWAGPTRVPASCILRAVSYEEGALPSRPLTLSFFIGRQHELPVLSLITDDSAAFWNMYKTSRKELELPGHLSWYEDGGSFSLPCGISLHGETSLLMRKKGMNIRFRDVYGQGRLEYDLFGGGVTSFTNLLIRAGQDQNATIIRNELCQSIALAVSDKVLTARSRYCILYINGEYSGIYALSEKLNEQFYADIAGVSRDSVTTVTGEAPLNSPLYEDVFLFCRKNDLSIPENYGHFLSLMDVDSLIDWFFLEGYFANTDLTYGNLRFCRSSEDDGRWRFMLYDLDGTLNQVYLNHRILLHRNNLQSVQVTDLFARLLLNPDFRSRFLTRSAELLNGPLSDEALLTEIDRLADVIRPEVARDLIPTGRSFSDWEDSIQDLKDYITSNNWNEHNIEAICRELKLSEEERMEFFGR